MVQVQVQVFISHQYKQKKKNHSIFWFRIPMNEIKDL